LEDKPFRIVRITHAAQINVKSL